MVGNQSWWLMISFETDPAANLAGKAHHAGHAIRALPARVLLVPEGGGARIRPGVHVRPVVGAVLHERVVGDAELVQEVEHLADALVVVDHHVVVLGLPAAGLATALRLHMRPRVHVRRVEPHEERLAGVVGGLDELLGRREELVVARLHPLLGQRTGVLDLLAALAVGPAVQHAAGPVFLLEVGEVLRVRIVHFLGFFLGVQVIQVAEELVEAVHRRQVLVAVTEVVLAELAGAIAERLERLGDSDVLGLEAQLRAGKTDLGEAGAQAALAGDERRAAGGAALLRVRVGEDHAFLGDAVDIGRPDSPSGPWCSN